MKNLLSRSFEFFGCKIALFCDDRILTILRDDKSNIP